jgi:hypothetical protein
MKAGMFFGWIATGAFAVTMAASIVLSASPRALAQDDTETSSPDIKVPPAQMAGTWTGDIVISAKAGGGTGTLTLELTQVKTTVGGTFTVSGGGSKSPSGTIRGKVAGDKVTLLASPTSQNHPCHVHFKGVVLGPAFDEYKGSFSSIVHNQHCNVAGTFDIFLQ